MRDVERWRERNRQLHANFDQLLGKEQGSLVAYHLGDIREGAAKLVEIIDRLAAANPPLDRNKTARDLQSIVDEFDVHLLPSHVTPLRPLVEPLIDELYAKFDDEEDEADGGEQTDVEEDRPI
jgi:hypothetical protein